MEHLDREEVWYVQSFACILRVFSFDPLLDLRRVRSEIKKRVNRSRCVQDYRSVLLRVPVAPDYDRWRFVQIDRLFPCQAIHQLAQSRFGGDLLDLCQKII